MVEYTPRWEVVGGKVGRFGKLRPWFANLIVGWEDDPDRPLKRRKVIARHEGPFLTKRQADAFVELQK